MADTERPPKRPRVSDEGQPECSQALSQPSGVVRHDEIWMDDGNIVLIAGETAFKVDGELLSDESTVFERMLSSTPAADEVFDGYPVVRLPDNPTDLAEFLWLILPISKQRRWCISFTDIVIGTFTPIGSLARTTAILRSPLSSSSQSPLLRTNTRQETSNSRHLKLSSYAFHQLTKTGITARAHPWTSPPSRQ